MIHGFKSFASKTSLVFKPGMTAIVGPNGCGKSNIVDAIRWVLGESSARSLRAEVWGDVIFSGSDERKPLGMAEVGITFANDDGLLPVEYSEVNITRRLYRSGESEFILNKNAVRLKDIHELFADTGIGIAAEVKDKIFDPFFTTKGPEKGTGLGLAIIASLLHQHHAGITLKSEVGPRPALAGRSGRPTEAVPRRAPW